MKVPRMRIPQQRRYKRGLLEERKQLIESDIIRAAIGISHPMTSLRTSFLALISYRLARRRNRAVRASIRQMVPIVANKQMLCYHVACGS